MQFIEVKYKQENVQAMVLWSIEKIEFMKGNGKMITGKEKEWKDIVMEINMKVIFTTVKLMEKEYIIGLTEKYMMENGEMESKKVMECGEVFLVIHTLVNGRIARLMDMVSINGKMETDMKVLG